MLGSNFIDWLVKNKPNYKIVGIDNLEGGYLDNVHPDIDFYLRDVGNDLTDIFEKYQVKYFYNFASYSAEGLSPFMRKFNYMNNLISAANVINFCIKYKVKLIQASSMSVYGIGTPPFKETDYLQPIDPYGIGKMAIEQDIKVAALQHGLKYSIIRPHNIIGPKQNMWDRYRNVIGIFMRQLINDEPITIYGDGEQRRAFSWVFDYCEPFWKVAVNDYDSPIFNVGGDKDFSLNEVAKMLIEISGKSNAKIIHLQPRHEVKTAFCDHTKAKTILGFVDKTPLNRMLIEMWNWAIKQPNRPVKSWDKYELNEGIYDFWK